MLPRTRKVSDLVTDLESRIREKDAEILILNKQLQAATNAAGSATMPSTNPNDLTMGISEVPLYLQKSEHFLNLINDALDNDNDNNNKNENDPGNISQLQIVVPKNCVKQNTTIQSDSTVSTISNLHHLLVTLKFWIVSPLPESLISFALDPETAQVAMFVAEEFLDGWSELETLMSVASSSVHGCNEQLLTALEEGASREILRHVMLNHDDSCGKAAYEPAATVDVANAAALQGSLDVFHFLEEQGLYSFDKDTPRNICAHAAQSGNLECLQFLRERKCPWSHHTLNLAASKGHLHCLQYAHENSCRWEPRRYGETAVVENACDSAAQNGHIECLKYAHQHGCPMDPQVCENAVISGSLDCLQYAHENGCIISPSCTELAALYDQLPCLQYAHTHGRKMNKRDCEGMIFQGNIECLQYYQDQGRPWPNHLPYCALEPERLQCLKYLVDNGCPVDETTTEKATKRGNLEALMYLHEKGCPYDSRASTAAILRNDVDILVFLLTNGCPVDKHGLYAAAASASASCIDDATAAGASSYSECARYLQSQGFNLPDEADEYDSTEEADDDDDQMQGDGDDEEDDDGGDDDDEEEEDKDKEEEEEEEEDDKEEEEDDDDKEEEEEEEEEEDYGDCVYASYTEGEDDGDDYVVESDSVDIDIDWDWDALIAEIP